MNDNDKAGKKAWGSKSDGTPMPVKVNDQGKVEVVPG